MDDRALGAAAAAWVTAGPASAAPAVSTRRLLPAVLGGKDALSPEALKRVMALNGPQPARFALQVVKAWAVIIGALAGAWWMQAWWADALAIVVIATRQNVLGLLVHEQTHLGLGGKYGDWLANWFCAYPLLALTVEGYAQVHLVHHRDYFKPSDPDALRKSGAEWAFPKSRAAMAQLFLRDIIGANTLKMVRGKGAKPPAGAPLPRRHQAPPWLRLLFLGLLIGTLSWTHTWGAFLLFWLLPLVTLLPAIVRWGAACEHEYNQPGGDMLETTPLIIQPWYERLALPMLNFGLHAYHHMLPGVSFVNLPKVHAIFQEAGLVDESRVFRGSRQYLAFLMGAPHAQGQPPSP